MSVPLIELSSWKRLKRYREEAIHFLTQNAAILRGGHNVVPQVWGCPRARSTSWILRPTCLL